MWSHVGILAGRPAILPDLRISEIIAWLNIAQDALGKHLLDVESWNFETTSSQTLAIGTAGYTLPRDFSEIVSVRYDGANGGTFYQANRLPLRDRGITTDSSLYTATMREPWYILNGYTLTVSPVPTATTTNGLEVTYRRKPSQLRIDRVKEGVAATSDGVAGGTTIIATALTEADDYWNECEVEITSLLRIYQKRVVTDFTASTDTLTFAQAFTGQVLSTTTFSIYDRSILPEEHHHLLVWFAAAMACGKLGNTEGFNRYMQMYSAGLEAIKAKYAQPVQDQLYSGEQMSKTNT